MLNVGASGPSFQAQARSDSGPMNALRLIRMDCPVRFSFFRLAMTRSASGLPCVHDLHQVLVGQAGQLDEIEQIPLPRPGQAQVVHQAGENLPRAGGPDRLVRGRDAALGEQAGLRQAGHVPGDVPAPAAPVPRGDENEGVVGIAQRRGEVALHVQDQAAVRAGDDLLQDRQQEVGLARSGGADHQHAGVGQLGGNHDVRMNPQPLPPPSGFAPAGLEVARGQGDALLDIGLVLQAANVHLGLPLEREPRQEPPDRQRQQHERAERAQPQGEPQLAPGHELHVGGPDAGGNRVVAEDRPRPLPPVAGVPADPGGEAAQRPDVVQVEIQQRAVQQGERAEPVHPVGLRSRGLRGDRGHHRAVLLKSGSRGDGGQYEGGRFVLFRPRPLKVLVELSAQRDHQRRAERVEGVAETRVHLFQRTAKLDVVLLGRRLVLLDRRQGSPQFQQRGLNDGFRLLEFRDFFSQLRDLRFQPVHSRVAGGGRVSAVPLALQTIPGRLSKPIARAFAGFLDGFRHVGIHADGESFRVFQLFRFHGNTMI